ncbi:MAG: deoxyribose-phosphate aldolase [Verrucomicrobiota bacterium]
MSAPDTKEFLARTELVLVRPDATRKEIELLCRHARENNFRAICVNSSRVAQAFGLLEDSDVKVISTVGFPIGAADSDVKRYETEVAIDHGAQEFELVLNLGHLKDREEANMLRELRDIVDAAEERPVSLLLGTKLLAEDEQVFICNLALEVGVKLLNVGNADIETIKFLRETLGKKCGIKVTGEIADAQTARELIEIGATHFTMPFIAQT